MNTMPASVTMPSRAGVMLRQAALSARPQLATLAYTLRTMLAVGIALFVSFSLQLQAPMSSVVTVLIVANPLTGALVSKSLWRLFGTVLGAAVAVALIAAFAQTPILFTVVLSLCIGVACVVSSLLRYFRAYGAVLAGYTIIIVASGSYMQPLTIFTGALSRVSAVSIGIVSAALVFLLTSLPKPSTLDQTIETLVRDIAGSFVLYRRPGGTDSDTLPRTGLFTRSSALDEAIEYAGADSYVLRRRMDRLRLGAARLLGLLSTLEPLHDGLRDAAPEGEAAQAQALVRDTMQRLSTLAPGGLASSLPGIEAAHAQAAALADGLRDPVALTVVLHERDMLEQLAHAVADLTGAGPRQTPVRLRPYLEWGPALRNGVRGGLVTLIGGLVWYVTQWTAGPTMLAFLVPGACLLSTNPSASAASVRFATGTLLALPVSMLCQTFLLPQITGFPLLWASLCLCMAPGIWLQFSPTHGLRAFGFVVFFNAMINVHNPITYDDIGLFNTWLAFLLGAPCLVIVFRVLLPTNPAVEVRRLTVSLARAVELLSRTRPVTLLFWPLPVWEVWQNQQMQKILRLIQRLQQVPGAATTPVLQAACIVVALGRVVLTLQALRRDPALAPEARAAASQALSALRQVRSDPARTGRSIIADSQAVQPLLQPGPDQDASSPPSPALHLLVGTLGEAALLVDRAQGLLDRRCPLLEQHLPAAGAP